MSSSGLPAPAALAPELEATRAPALALAKAAAILTLVAVMYHRTAATLWHIWTTNDNYSHGPLVPLVAAGLVWVQRGRLAALTRRPDSRGLAVVALGCALLVTGLRADVFTLQGWSIPVLVAGLSLTFLGPEMTRALAFPIAFLVFMLTFPPIVVTQLSFTLKEAAVRLSTHAAEALGVLVQRSGMTLHLVGGDLRVENPCSGLRSLIALLATGSVFAWLQPGGGWRAIIVLLAAIPLALLGNAIRLTAVLLVAHYDGIAHATGAFHDLSGYAVYALALAGLFGLRWLLTPRRAAAKA